MRTRISLLARAVPRIAVAYTMRSGALSPPGLALVARCTSPLLLKLSLTQPDGSPTDILSWWKLRDHSLPADPVKGRPEGLPRLARMARQYHGEPAASAGAERLFSAASRAHHDLKGAMADNSLEHQLLAMANTD